MSAERITLGHGAGGTAMRTLIRDMFAAKLNNSELAKLADGARLTLQHLDIVFTTDSYVVQPIEFAGGDLGKLAVCGTVNDLLVMGAEPRYLSLALILEEGLELSFLERLVDSIALTAKRAGIEIVTGDTKVVPHGQCDRVFINTTGIGTVPFGLGLSLSPIVAGDVIIISGTIGEHAVAILGAREELKFDSHVQSDCAPLVELIGAVLKHHSGVKWMRDPTRGGLAAVLDELAQEYECGVLIRETAVPVRSATKAVCELLGFDPMHLANEGKVVMVVAQSQANEILKTMKACHDGLHAAQIGEITGDNSGYVRVITEFGGVRRLQRPSGELLPRIC